ncbi:MAG: hypothetical protein K0Q49_237 [Haloplasmataceae bacterium]|nr:hypothetical protein [Haloplasmataceae bacterium]
MKKVVLLPLDERPCNYVFPQKLFKGENFNIVRPGLEIMGDKKQAGNLEAIRDFVLNETKDAYGLVISIDTLLYGGIVPSRLHYDKIETLKERLNILKLVKENNPKIKIFAFHLIMRCPKYSSSDEEPDYYELCGREIFLHGFYKHKMELSLASPEEVEHFNNLKFNLDYLNDFLNRRKINTAMTIESINFVKQNLIDFLIVPQDDSAEFGWTAMDQKVVRKEIEDNKLQLKVYMYPGADEVANTLLSRLLCESEHKRPLVYIKYPTITSGSVIPAYEDRYLDTTIKYQILGAGGLIATSVNEADIILFVNSPSDHMMEAAYQMNKKQGYTTMRNMVEWIEYMDYCVNELGKPVIVADVAFANGAELELISLLEQKGLTMKVASYAGWNTSSNTLGTCIPQGIVYWMNGNTPSHKSFLAARYVEDAGYCSFVRKYVSDHYLDQFNFNYFYVKDQRGVISNIVKEELFKFLETYIPSIAKNVVINDIYMPWRRMFEVGLDITYKD